MNWHMKLAPGFLHYVMWALGVLCSFAPKMALGFPSLAPVLEQVGQQGPLVMVALGWSSSSAIQQGQAAAASPVAISVEQALAVVAAAAQHKPAPASPPVVTP